VKRRWTGGEPDHLAAARQRDDQQPTSADPDSCHAMGREAPAPRRPGTEDFVTALLFASFASSTGLVTTAAAADAAHAPSPARVDAAAPESAAEADAAARVAARRCGWGWGLVVPGASRYCYGRPVEGTVLTGLALAELGAALALEGPATTFPLIGLQNLYTIDFGASAIDRALAKHRPYTPTEPLGSLVTAPFRPEVLKDPGVWLAGGLVTATAVGLSLATTRWDPDASPRVLGADLPAGAAVPAFVATDAALMMHVAVGEEVLFRGVVQSALSRWTDPTAGWLIGTLVFTAVHAPNALALPPPDRRAYLLVGLPWLTVVGGTIGAVYQRSGFRLGPPVAVHFWYDFLLSAAQFTVNPNDHFLSARVGGRF
jgi:membrane protease YdiL (CAAX protease family)